MVDRQPASHLTGHVTCSGALPRGMPLPQGGYRVGSGELTPEGGCKVGIGSSTFPALQNCLQKPASHDSASSAMTASATSAAAAASILGLLKSGGPSAGSHAGIESHAIPKDAGSSPACERAACHVRAEF